MYFYFTQIIITTRCSNQIKKNAFIKNIFIYRFEEFYVNENLSILTDSA